MNPNDPNVAMVEAVAARLGALRRRMVFVGGCAAGLLITDPALPAIRVTEDVDVVVEVAKLSDYHKLEKQMAAAGFERDMREGRRSAAGGSARRFSTSCRSTRGSSGSATAGIRWRSGRRTAPHCRVARKSG